MMTLDERAQQADFGLLEQPDLAAMGSEFRQTLLAELETPLSATALARRHGTSRQRIGYHMRDLERAGCITVVAERQNRGLTEKLYQVTPRVFVQAPLELASRITDRFSFTSLFNLLAGALAGLSRLRRRADAESKRLATLALDAELHFASPAERRAFTEDLLDAVESVVRKHETQPGPETRAFRLILAAFPEHRQSAANNGSEE